MVAKVVCSVGDFFCFFISEGLEFKTTNLELYRPVVVGETVDIDCATNEKNAKLQLLLQRTGSDSPTVLKVSLINIFCE